MDSLKETDKPAPNPPKRSRIEAEEEQMHRTDRRTSPFGFESRPPDSRTGRGKYGRSRGKDIGNCIRSIGADC